jgi:hypothetical protein
MNKTNSIVGEKLTQNRKIMLPVLVVAVLASGAGIAMGMPSTVYANEGPFVACNSVGGDGGEGGSGGLSELGGPGGAGGTGGEGGNALRDGEGGDGGNALGGDGGDSKAGDGGHGGDGGKSRLACVLIAPSLTVNAPIEVPGEAFEPRP